MISVKDLHKSFGGVTVLDGISTDIEESSIRAYINALNKIAYEEQN